MVVRLRRRKASFIDVAPAEAAQVEFPGRSGGLDLCPSAYQVGRAGEVVQVHAEHQASFFKTPTVGLVHFDVTGLNERSESTPGDSRFEFTRNHHLELRFADAGELIAFVAALQADLDARSLEVSRLALTEFVRGRLEVGDPEWRGFLHDPRAKAWMRELKIPAS